MLDVDSVGGGWVNGKGKAPAPGCVFVNPLSRHIILSFLYLHEPGGGVRGGVGTAGFLGGQEPCRLWFVLFKMGIVCECCECCK